jgi:hypothetical protein
METVHESLHEEEVPFPCRLHHHLGLLGIGRQRFLAEHMLSRLYSAKSPFPMEMIGERNVNRLHLWVFEKFLIRPIGNGNGMFLGQ